MALLTPTCRGFLEIVKLRASRLARVVLPRSMPDGIHRVQYADKRLYLIGLKSHFNLAQICNSTFFILLNVLQLRMVHKEALAWLALDVGL